MPLGSHIQFTKADLAAIQARVDEIIYAGRARGSNSDRPWLNPTPCDWLQDTEFAEVHELHQRYRILERYVMGHPKERVKMKRYLSFERVEFNREATYKELLALVQSSRRGLCH